MAQHKLQDTATTIARQLGETEPSTLAQIQHIVQRLGPETALAFLQETLETEARGGMMLPDGSRRRTPGGVFFYLVRSRISARDRAAIFPHQKPPKQAKSQPPFSGDERLHLIGDLLSEIGAS